MGHQGRGYQVPVACGPDFLCRGLLIDVPRHGVASAANVVYGRHYTGCVDDGKASRVLVDAADKS